MPYHRPIPGRKDSDVKGGMHMFVEAEKLMHIAFVLPTSVFVGWLGGAWIGSKVHQSWPMIVGILLGCVSGLIYVIRMAIDAEKKATRSDEAAEEAEKQEKGSGQGSSQN